MNRVKLPISKILVEDRQRQDLGDIPALADSLARYGLIQPVVINQDNRLLAGGRRLAAALYLKWTEIDVVYKETLSLDEAFELELEENVRRKDMSWQERALNIYKIYRIKKDKAAIDGVKWGMIETGELLGMSKTHTNYCILVAKELLKSPDCKGPYWEAETIHDAWRYMLRLEQDRIQAELARRAKERANDIPDDIVPILGDYVALDGLPIPEETIDLAYEDAKRRYLSNPHNDSEKFDEYYKSKNNDREVQENTILLSNRYFMGDGIKFMVANREAFDHLITDIPYGVDMDMLNQQNPHGGMVDLDTIIDEHDVEYNMELIEQFFPAAFRCLKDNSFCITWCDQMVWQKMFDIATRAGFTVQRWPVTWNKLHRCMNQSAQYNFTKSTEIAMVCRKGNAVMMNPALVSVVSASNEEMKKLIGHPFAKPYECWAFFIHHCTFDGQLILDPFAGRGSSILSFLRMNRRAMGVEIQQEHYHALLENIKKYYISINSKAVFK
jgi:ParB family chromosome partitioning protein